MKPARGEKETHDLEVTIRKNDGTFRNKFIETGKRTSDWINLSDPTQMKLIEERYKNVRNQPAWQNEIEKEFWYRPTEAEATFKDYFKDPSNTTKITNLHVALWWNDALLEKRKPSSYDQILKNRYFYNPDQE